MSGHIFNVAGHCFSNTGLGPKSGLQGLGIYGPDFPVNNTMPFIYYFDLSTEDL